MKTLILAFSLLLFAVTASLATEPDRIAILLNESTLKALDEPLRTYVADVEARFPVKLGVIARQWRTPQEVRAAIRELHRENHITGVILIGAMPMHQFFMHEHSNPNPLYYEDFHLEFVDRNADGVDDAYLGTPELKLWVANIRATEKADQDDIPGLRRFFDKTHAYYTGKAVPEPLTLILSSEPISADWAGLGDWFKRKGAARFSAPGDTALLEGKACTRKSVLKAFAKHSYSLTCLALHSDETGHALYDEDLMASDLAEMKTGSLITIAHACFAANWTKNERDKNGPNCALSWVFGKHLGQAVIAQVRSGGAGFDEHVYERLRAGDYIGKAYLPCKQADENEHAKGDHVPGDIVSGVLMIGNPFLRLPPVKRESDNRLVIRKAVFGDLANHAVVNVTQKVTDWIEDSLPIEATVDNFGDPADGIEKQLKVDYTLDGQDGTITIEEGQLLEIGT